MLVSTINYSTWCLKYRDVDAGARASDTNMEKGNSINSKMKT